jgi:hypothetical protein
MIESAYLKDCVLHLEKLKAQADQAIAQVKDEQLSARLDPEANSIAIIIKHLTGNMQSRWTGFLTEDGEKPDRDRDAEFESRPEQTRDRILASWEDAWSRMFVTIHGLKAEDLARQITIRGESHSVLEAINRQMIHYAAHVGQIVLLAKHYAGPDWRTLSIPRGKSRTFDLPKNGGQYSV